MDVVVASPRPQIILNRTEFSNQSTIGEILIDKQPACYTLEDTARRIKNPGETAIPAGVYHLILAHSARFGFCPWLLNVPYFDGIRIHSGNSAADTHGCVLVGRTKGVDWIGESKLAFKALMEILEPMNRREKLWIEIRGGIPKEDFQAAA